MAFDWDHDTVLAGSSVNVRIDGAPCNPVTVQLLVRGEEVDTGIIENIPGDVDLDVPSGSESATFEIIVKCDGESDSMNGTVG